MVIFIIQLNMGIFFSVLSLYHHAHGTLCGPFYQPVESSPHSNTELCLPYMYSVFHNHLTKENVLFLLLVLV
jgi:hypothetical protein